jgi:hypothetical protein
MIFSFVIFSPQIKNPLGGCCLGIQFSLKNKNTLGSRLLGGGILIIL